MTLDGRGTTSKVYVCGFGCDTELQRDNSWLSGDPYLPIVVCGPRCEKQPKDAEVWTREALNDALERQALAK